MTASATSQLPARAHLLARLAHAVRREQVPLVLSVAAIGIHIADDNFVQPEPGHVRCGSPRERPRAACARAGGRRRDRLRPLSPRSARDVRPAARYLRRRRRHRGRLLRAGGGAIRRRLHRNLLDVRRLPAARCRRPDAVADPAHRRRPLVAVSAARPHARRQRASGRGRPVPGRARVRRHAHSGIGRSRRRISAQAPENIAFTTSDGLRLEDGSCPRATARP